MKLIHLTDTHVSERGTPAYRHLRALVAHVVELHADAVVVVTGDFINSGQRSEFDVVTGLLQPLTNHCRLLLVCPGNHDVEVMGTLGNVRHGPFAKFRRALTGVEAGYPYCMTIDSVQITLVDTTAEAGGIADLAEGKVGYAQRQELARYLELGAPHTRVVAGHHHLYCDGIGNELIDAREMRALCSGRCDLYLMGHDHHWGIWRDVDGIGWIADGGKSTRPHEGKLRYRVFDITADGIDYITEEIDP